ncbi:MAG TPA: hypothetical protein VET46_17390, partial [Steroidobacteraceae bacterium]|nr:hypothetical protein [Steroidobacteraceae bacterium]
MSDAAQIASRELPARTLADQVRWRLNRLRCMTPAEVPFRVFRTIAAHLGSFRPLRSHVPACDREPPSDRWIHVPEGLDPAPYVAAADRIAGGT